MNLSYLQKTKEHLIVQKGREQDLLAQKIAIIDAEIAKLDTLIADVGEGTKVSFSRKGAIIDRIEKTLADNLEEKKERLKEKIEA